MAATPETEFSADDYVFLNAPAKLIRFFEEGGIRHAAIKFEGLASPGVVYYLGVRLEALKRA